MPKNVSCYIAKMLKDHPGSINKWIKKLKPGALVEALKVTSKEIHAWEEEGQRAEEELRKEINERWDKLTSYERSGAECWSELVVCKRNIGSFVQSYVRHWMRN